MNDNAQMSNSNIVLKKCIYMACMGLLTEIVASFILTFILKFMPNTQQSYSDSLAPLLDITSTVIIATVFFAPIVEEIVFRFFILEGAKRFMPFVFANLIQAALFGIYHRQLVQGIYAFIIGFFIGYLRKICGNFFYGIIFHMTLNALGLYINVIIPSTTPLVVEVVIFTVSTVLLIISTLKLKRIGEC